MSEQLYCDVADCDDPKNPGFARPAFREGKCSSHMKQLQRTGRTTKIAEKLTLEERAIELGTAMLEADPDEEYEQHKRAWLSVCRALGDQERVNSLRQALAGARARGVRIGRPPKADRARVVQLVRLLGKTSLVAQVLDLSQRTVQRYLLQTTKPRVLSRQRLAG